MKELCNNEKSIDLLKTDNGAYFEVIYKSYFSALYSFASQYVEKEEAREIVQDTMLWLWENKASLIPELSLRSLLFTIVKNKCLNSIGHEQIKNKILENIKGKYQEEFENPNLYIDPNFLALFQQALDGLHENFRQAFEMSRMEGLTHKEIAKKLNVSPQTINYRLSKALKILRNELKEYLPVFFILLSL